MVARVAEAPAGNAEEFCDGVDARDAEAEWCTGDYYNGDGE